MSEQEQTLRAWIRDPYIVAIVNGRFGEIIAISSNGATIGTKTHMEYLGYQRQRAICKEYEDLGYRFTPVKTWRGDELRIERPKASVKK